MRQGLEAEVIMRPDSKKAFRDKIAKLEKDLKEAQIIIETQKKVQKLLGAAGRKSQVKSKVCPLNNWTLILKKTTN